MVAKLEYIAMAVAVGVAALTADPARALPRSSVQSTVRGEAGLSVPEYFQTYLITPMGDAGICVAGKVTDEDGMFSRPYAYVEGATGGNLRWAKFLDMPADFYEGRATHCVRKGDSLYVLLQLDTHAARSLSQTLLRIVKVRMNDGAFEGEAHVIVPNAGHTHTSWVWDDDGFKVVNDTLSVTGKYRYLDSEDHFTFSTTVKIWPGDVMGAHSVDPASITEDD